MQSLEDDALQKVIENLRKGRWNEHPRRIDTDTMKNFKKLRSELSVTRGGLLLKATKTVVSSGNSSGTDASRLPGDGEDKTFNLRNGVVPGHRCTG